MSHVICGIVVPSRIDEFNGKYHEDLENALLICTGKLAKNLCVKVSVVKGSVCKSVCV